ncbi:MAG: choice-of-anchor J domain-containing protein [Prevotella sp.]|nr:choice-of-anchor J domain-containing protein [Prevotella sp.]
MKKIIYSMMALAMTAFAFTSCEDVPMPYNMTFEDNGTTPNPGAAAEPKGTGTEADPFNVAAAMNYITAGENLDKEVYVAGTIVSIKEVDDGNYGNATYYISDDGKSTGQLTVYRGYALGNKHFTSKDQIKAGDKVVVYGKLVNFNGTKEFTQGNYIYSLNGEKGGSETAAELNTEATAWTVAQAIQKIKDNGGKALAGEAYVKGIISEVASYNADYKSITYYISDNGTDKALQIYSGKGKDGADFAAKEDLKAGQTVVVKGILKAYTNKAGETTMEMDKSSKIISITAGAAGEQTGSVVLSATFATTMDNFTIADVTLPEGLTFIWKLDAAKGYMKASAFKDNIKYATQSRLVSPAFSLAGKSTATLSFQHTGKHFGTVANDYKVQVSTDGTTWTDLTVSSYPDGSSWNFVDATCDLSAYAGKPTVYIAFLYTSSADAAGTWEVKNVTVK